jgi:hypothetical protein
MALAMVATAFGYAGQVLGTISVAGPSGTLKCNVPITVTATLLDVNGVPFSGEPVTWAITSTPSSSDRVNDTSTTTNASGVTTTTVTLACVAGNRTVTATSDQLSAGAVLSLTSAGLPRTSTITGDASSDVPIGTIVALLAVLAGAGIITRRIVTRPR